jgi:hypothetical protein
VQAEALVEAAMVQLTQEHQLPNRLPGLAIPVVAEEAESVPVVEMQLSAPLAVQELSSFATYSHQQFQ